MKQARVIALSETELEAEVWIEPYHPEKHLLKHEIKAVTYYQLVVKPCSDGWENTIVFVVYKPTVVGSLKPMWLAGRPTICRFR